MRHLPTLLLFAACASAASAQECVAYRRATIETMGKAGRLENATLVLRGGKIEAVGVDVKIPDDAKVIDAAGSVITPGFLEPYYEIPIAGAGGGDSGGQTIVIRGRVITLPGGMRPPGAAFTRVADNLNPYDRSLRPFVRSGLVAMNLVASGQGLAAVAQPGVADPEQQLLQADGCLFVTVTNSTESLDSVRTRLEAAARLKRTSGAATLPSSTSPASGLLGQMANQMKPWTDVYEGKSPLFVSVASGAAVLHLAKLMPLHKDVRWVLVGSGESFAETLDALRGQKVTVVVRPNVEMEPTNRNRMSIAGRLHAAGIPFAFTQTANLQGGGGASPFGMVPGGGGTAVSELLAGQDFPLFAVAFLVKCGLPRQAALEALTLRPAQLLGLEKTHGSIEPGKTASLLVFQGDPFDPQSRLKAVLVGGKTVHEN